MLELIKRTKIIFIICIAIIVLFNSVMFGLMRIELEKSITINFTELSNSKHASLSNSIHSGMDGAIALSSRTMIKEKIKKYLESSISLIDLQAFTQPKYVDGAVVLDNVIAAARLLDGSIIASYTNPEYDINILDLDPDTPSEGLTATMVGVDGSTYLVVNSPVIEGEALLAVDRVIFDMDSSISKINDAQVKVTVINNREATDIESDSEILDSNTNYTLCRDDNNYIFIRQLLASSCVMITTLRSDLMKSINQLTFKMMAATVLVFLSLLLVFYLTIIRFANKLLDTAEKSRNKFESLAYRDELTGAYSRIFLDFWKENLYIKGHPYCIIMIDLDELKDINDEMGHLIGDEVLKIVASAVTRTIRTDDIFIRFGGDEFLIILENVTESTGENIMQRIESKLNENHRLDISISISYGVYVMNNESDFNDALLIADRRMYMTKKLKKEKPSD